MTRIVQVDAFTAQAFKGNPAGVCFVNGDRADSWMLGVAAEMNLAETAFLRRRADGSYDLRWFTPVAEVDLCGHATLASAHVLWEDGDLPESETARFHTKSGLLKADRRGEWIELDFPATPPESIEPPEGLLAALGAKARSVGKSRFDYLVELESEEAVARLRPDLGRLEKFPVRGVIVTAPSASPPTDFVSRFFAPAVGVPEDPVTGSAHCCLAPFWGARLGKDTLLARQISSRGGVLRLRLAGDRVLLGGQAITVIRGDLLA
ncbi:MAG TPA: PhzF family phenazine biosynthesis protein [Thermoanaerobaculia bacterium]|nr:PhzF family phenazine biosynthesis protein [Thermoanaerobaculia bacterium]